MAKEFPKVFIEVDVIAVETNEYKGNVYRNAVVNFDGSILQFSLSEGVALSEGKDKVLQVGFRKYGSDIKAQPSIVGVGTEK